MNYAGSTCICRVPKAHLKDGTVVECTHCGKYSFPSRLFDCWLTLHAVDQVVEDVHRLINI